jgi:hypothetical protein
MKIVHSGFEVTLKDDWLAEAEMSRFVPTSKAYRVDPHWFAKDRQIRQIRIRDIAPVERHLGDYGVFRNRESVLEILRGFRLDHAIPPVEITSGKTTSHRYKLYNGTHRLYCSLAVGFTHVPAVPALDNWWD